MDHIQKRREEFPGVPAFIVGHSMGGLIALQAVLDKPDLVNGIVLIAPLVEIDPSMGTPFNIFVAKWLHRVLPSFPISGIDKELLCRDKQEIERMENDKLIRHKGVKLKNAFEGLVALADLEKRMGEIKIPILVMQGTADAIVRPEGAKTLVESVASEDKELREYQGAYHNLCCEPELKETIPQEIETWISARI